MMSYSQASQLQNVIPNLGCASCGNNTERHVSADGNFKLTRIHREELIKSKSKLKRFILSDDEVYDYANGQDITNACTSNLKAINERAVGRNGPKFDQTGIIGLFCARHGTPILFVNCYAGERSYYIDSLLIHFLRQNHHVSKLFFYYDINCNYSLHFKKYKIGNFKTAFN